MYQLVKWAIWRVGSEKRNLRYYFCIKKLITKIFFMLQSISWQTYFTVSAVLLAIYYVAILLLYYRQDMAMLFRQQVSFKNQTGSFTKQEQASGDINTLGANLEDEIIAYAASAGADYNKTELQYGLQLLLKKYAVLKDSILQPEITKTIISACENNCSIVLSDEEAGMLWNG